MAEPLVSILLPVFNAERYLRDALGSMQAQSFDDWEMICIDDGSRDGSPQILDALAEREPRARIIHQPNQGLVRTLNTGIGLARGSLICRMDADDIALPDRLTRQVAFLRDHPEHIAVGGAILKIDADSDPLGVERLPTEHADIEHALLHRQTGLFHPTTLIRTSALSAVGGYREEYEWVEDHDLWLRLAQRGRLGNLNELVLCYRLHAGSVCWQRSAVQRERMTRLLSEAYGLRGLSPPQEILLGAGGSRSAAGPGKWARMAAKGCAPRTALKHLWRLWREPAALNYRLRMTLETLARVALSLPRLPLARVPAVPRY
jgi:glycosyltransferase involved in cell wall biosynthesis